MFRTNREAVEMLTEQIKTLGAQMLRELEAATDDQLHQKPNPDDWSALQIAEHVDYALRAYWVAGSRAVQNAPDGGGEKMAQASGLGKFLYKMMSNPSKTKIPKPPSVKEPADRPNKEAVLRSLSDSVAKYVELGQASRDKNLVQAKFQNPLAPLFRMRGIDLFAVQAAHMFFHAKQITERIAQK